MEEGEGEALSLAPATTDSTDFVSIWEGGIICLQHPKGHVLSCYLSQIVLYKHFKFALMH